MRKLKKFNSLLIFIAIAGGIYLSVMNLVENDMYRLLINFTIIPTMMLPIILKKWFKLKIDNITITMYLIFVFTGHFLGALFDLYNIIYFYDKVIHFLSGIVSSFVAIYMLVYFEKYFPKQIIFNCIFIMAVTFLTAGLWEIIEYTSDNIFNQDAQRVALLGIHDTMLDIIGAFLGSLIVIVIYLFEELSNKKILILKYIMEVSSNVGKQRNNGEIKTIK